jgi:hypothetical protein
VHGQSGPCCVGNSAKHSHFQPAQLQQQLNHATTTATACHNSSVSTLAGTHKNFVVSHLRLGLSTSSKSCTMGKQSRRRSAAGQSPAGRSSISSSVPPTPAVRASSEPPQQQKKSRARELFWSFVRSSFCAFGYLFYIRYNNGKNTPKVSTFQSNSVWRVAHLTCTYSSCLYPQNLPILATIARHNLNWQDSTTTAPISRPR